MSRLEFGVWDLGLGIYSRRRSGVSRETLRRSLPLRRSVNCSSVKPLFTSARSSSDWCAVHEEPSSNSCVVCVFPGPYTSRREPPSGVDARIRRTDSDPRTNNQIVSTSPATNRRAVYPTPTRTGNDSD